jgi:toxin ParE1/3/4
MKVRYTPRSLANIDRIFEYIARENPAAASRVMARFEDLIGQIADIPEMAADSGMPGIRKLVVAPYPYLIFYEVGSDEVIIHHVRHAARRPWSGRTRP